MSGSLKGGLAGAMWGAVGAFAAYTGAELAGRLAGITNSAVAHAASLLKSGLTKLTAIKFFDFLTLMLYSVLSKVIIFILIF